MRKNDFDIVSPQFLYKMDEHAQCLFETEPRGFYWHPIYKHWIIFSMDRLKEASLMNETFSLATTSPAPFDPTPMGGVWRAGYALTLREGAHHWLAKSHSREWAKRQAPVYTDIFMSNFRKNLDLITSGKSFSTYDVVGRAVTDTQIQMIHIPWDHVPHSEQTIKDGFHEWMRPGNVFSNFNPDFDYDKPVAQTTEFYKNFSECVAPTIEYYGTGDGVGQDTMINMTYTLSDKQWEFNDNPYLMSYMFIQSLWTTVIPTFALSLYQNLIMRMCEHPKIIQRIREDRSLVPLFTREVLRLAPMKGGIRDVPDTVEYHGYKIDYGSRILLYTYGANRDPAHYKDPLKFRLHREDEPDPVTLAYGPHHCTGDFIIKHFMELIVHELLDRFDQFEMTQKPELLPAMFGSTTVYKDLQVRFTKERIPVASTIMV